MSLSDSLAMERLRRALLGKNGQNLNDIEFMSGMKVKGSKWGNEG